jgi:hypothetical protein
VKILIAYPGHGFSTIDVANGYKKALKDLGHDVWAFNYHESLSFYMAALDRWEELNPGLERLNDDFGVLASERLFIETFDYVPDVVLIVFGLALHRRVYDMLTKLGVPKVLLLTESPYDDYNQAPIIEKGGIAATFTNDRASVKPLRKATGGRVEYLPTYHIFSFSVLCGQNEKSCSAIWGNSVRMAPTPSGLFRAMVTMRISRASSPCVEGN